VRHPLVPSGRLPIQDIEFPNDFRVGVGQQRKHDLVPLGEVLQDRRIVIADRGQLDPLLLKS
jgi:hypothetical protein